LRNCGALAQARKRLVGDDAEQPSRELRRAAETADGAISTQIRFLQRIFRLSIVFQNAARRPVERPVVLPHQLPECGLIASHHPQRQLQIR
jgi:hypothetical protein